MRLSALVSAVAFAAGLVVLGAPAASATVDPVAILPINGIADMVVDDAHARVFVAGRGTVSNVILVRDFEGGAVGSITVPGDYIAHITLSSDGGTLWAALPTAHRIVGYDTATLAETERVELGDVFPHCAVQVGTVLWFCHDQRLSGTVGRIDLSAEPREAAYDVADPSLVMGNLIPSPADPARIAGITYSDLLVSFVVDGTTLATATSVHLADQAASLAFTADGAHVVVAIPMAAEFPRLAFPSLAGESSYPRVDNDGHPNAIDVSPAGYVVTGIAPFHGKDLRVYSPAGAFVREYDLGDGSLLQGGARFSADGSRLFAAAANNTTTIRLLVLHDPTKAPSSVSLSKPASATVNKAFAIAGKITAPTPVAAGTVVHVVRTSKYGAVPRPDVVTGSGGAFTISDTVTKRGSYTYLAHWDGDGTSGSASVTTTFTVTGLVPALSIATNASLYDYARVATVSAHLGTTSSSRSVTLTAQPYGTTSRRTLKSGNVDAGGNISAQTMVYSRVVFAAFFYGDDVYEPRTVTRTVTVHARMTASLSGYYATSNGYRIYRRSVDPVLTVTATGEAGGCMYYVAEVYRSGAWRNVASNSCITMTSAGVAKAVLTGTPYVGVPYRLRGTFTGSIYHARTDGPWVYLKFTY